MSDFKKRITEFTKSISEELSSRGIDDYVDIVFIDGEFISAYSGGTTMYGIDEYVEWVKSHKTKEESRLIIANHHANMQKQIEAMEW